MKKHSAFLCILFDYDKIVIIFCSTVHSRPDVGVNLERSLIGCLQLYEHWYEFSFPSRTCRISSRAAKIPKIKKVG